MLAELGKCVDLTGARLVAQGRTRLIFEHDRFPGALIKVVKPSFTEMLSQPGARKRKRFRIKLRRRLGHLMGLHRELQEYLVLMARASGRADQPPIQRVFGFVETNLGFGVVVERYGAPDGSLAPTLRTLVREGRYEDTHQSALETFLSELQELHILFSDLNAANLVYVSGDGGSGRFVGIDGMGDRALIPLTNYSKLLNAWQIRRRAKKKIWPFVGQVVRKQNGTPE